MFHRRSEFHAITFLTTVASLTPGLRIGNNVAEIPPRASFASPHRLLPYVLFAGMSSAGLTDCSCFNLRRSDILLIFHHFSRFTLMKILLSNLSCCHSLSGIHPYNTRVFQTQASANFVFNCRDGFGYWGMMKDVRVGTSVYSMKDSQNELSRFWGFKVGGAWY